MSGLSVVIPYYGNDVLRNSALRMLLIGLERQNFKGTKEVIIVRQKHCSEEYDPFLSDDNDGFDLEHADIVDKLITLENQNSLFNKSWAINVGVRQAIFETVLVLDADIICAEDYLKVIVDYNVKNFAVGWSRLLLLPGRDNPICRHTIPGSLKTAGGAFVFKKKFFNSVGMMNENYIGYGGEDNDMYDRVEFVLQQEKQKVDIVSYTLAHTYHDWMISSETYRGNKEYLSNVALLARVRSSIPKVIELLKTVNLGNKAAPTLIEI